MAGQDAGEEMTCWLVAILMQVYCYERAHRFTFYWVILKIKDAAQNMLDFNAKIILYHIYTPFHVSLLLCV